MEVAGTQVGGSTSGNNNGQINMGNGTYATPYAWWDPRNIVNGFKYVFGSGGLHELGQGMFEGADQAITSKLQEMTGSSDPEDDVISQWAAENGYKLDKDTMDYLYNQYFTEKNTQSAWQRTLEADSTQYQRAVADMKKAGLNPFLLLNSGGSSPSAQAGSVGSGSIAAQANSRRQSQTDILKQIISIVGLIAAASIYAA